MARLTFLITNDDGIDSPFLAALVEALSPHGRCAVVAPSGERSWISKAMSRHNRVSVRPRADLLPCPAWEVDGTPADCVNLAIHHVLRERPRLVVSGINIGSNASLPLILASGTVGAATEGALQGFGAVASSLRLNPADFAVISKDRHAPLASHVRSALAATAAITAGLCATLARKRSPQGFCVHNLNFPPTTSAGSTLERTVPARMRASSQFTRVPDSEDGSFQFAFGIGEEQHCAHATDRDCMEAGIPSHSILDLRRLGVTNGVKRTNSSRP